MSGSVKGVPELAPVKLIDWLPFTFLVTTPALLCIVLGSSANVKQAGQPLVNENGVPIFIVVILSTEPS
ncbi:hypothetical protein DYY66_0696 [Candidatus Nitrosotalea sp. FS]|nr:hypothetical protein [Candidatus Nitrosotalea sp. FS]